MKRLVKALIIGWIWAGVRRRLAADSPRVIAVTGSVGKTSVKDAVSLVLETAGSPVVKTQGGMNTEIGVPLSLLGFSYAPSGIGGWFSVLMRALMPPKSSTKNPYYVLEYSADKPGDIAYLAKRIAPEVAILTSIVPVHMQFYPEFKDLVAEKLSLLAGLKEGGTAILNADDPEQSVAGKGRSVIWYGMKKKKGNEAGVWGSDLELTEKGWRLRIDFGTPQRMDAIGKGQRQSLVVQTTLIGKHQVYSLLAAAAVGFKEGISTKAIGKALESYMVPAGRGRLIKGRKDIVIIDDSYNASLPSVKSGLEMVRPFAKTKRTVAIIGNMNELGSLTEESHHEAATFAATQVDCLIAVGPESEAMVAAAREAGMQSQNAIGFRTPEQLMDKIDQVVKKGDVIYIKGSQNKVRLERVVKMLMADPSKADQLLARQSEFWKKRL